MTPNLRSEPRWTAFVDLLALLLLLLTVWVLIVGGFHLKIGPLLISVTSWTRVAMEAAIVLVLRYGLTGPLVPTRASRLRFVLAYGVLLVTLACSSTQRRVGDGGEYLAMALNLSRMHPPAISDGEMGDIERTFASLGNGFEGFSLVNPDFRGRDGRQDLIHFWLYPLLAAPWVWVARGLALPVNACFAFVNILLLVLALWVASGHIRRGVAMLIFVGPIIWWSDKGHTEAFTFALLVVAVTLVSTAPWWSLVALGAAAAQNPGIALTVPMVALVVLVTRPGAWRDGRFWAGAVAGASLAAMHPLYYWVRLGRPSLLFGITLRQVPSFAVWSAPLIDPNIGVFATFPWLTLALAVALAIVIRRSPSRLLDPSVLVALAASALFVVSYSQIPNVNSGGTPGMSRYGLWIVPMALPIFAQYDAVARRPHVAWLAALALASSIWCVFYYQPRTGENYWAPSALADLLWTRYPSINNPLPEIFGERVIGRGDESWLPVATSRCEKVLLLGDGRREPFWPVTLRARVPAIVVPDGRLALLREPQRRRVPIRRGSPTDGLRAALRPDLELDGDVGDRREAEADGRRLGRAADRPLHRSDADGQTLRTDRLGVHAAERAAVPRLPLASGDTCRVADRNGGADERKDCRSRDGGHAPGRRRRDAIPHDCRAGSAA